jgi:hypothetical protein
MTQLMAHTNVESDWARGTVKHNSIDINVNSMYFLPVDETVIPVIPRLSRAQSQFSASKLVWCNQTRG